MEQARHGGMSDFLATFYRVFQDQFDPSQAPTATDVIAPIQDVVFDHRGLYYAAVPLDFRERNYKEWLERRVGRERAEQIFEATSDKPLEESRYITSVFAALEGTDFITLIDPAREGFVTPSPKPEEQGGRADPQAEAFRFIRSKLDQQGSVYAQADAFRVYRFREKAWGQILIQSVGSSAAQSERNWRRQTRGARRPVRTASDQAKALAASEEFRGEAKAVEGPPKKVAEQVSSRPSIEDRRQEAEKKEPQKLGFVEGVDEDRDPDHYGDGAQKLNGNPKTRDVPPEGEKPKTRET
jgi:hypothetical protein